MPLLKYSIIYFVIYEALKHVIQIKNYNPANKMFSLPLPKPYIQLPFLSSTNDLHSSSFTLSVVAAVEMYCICSFTYIHTFVGHIRSFTYKHTYAETKCLPSIQHFAFKTYLHFLQLKKPNAQQINLPVGHPKKKHTHTNIGHTFANRPDPTLLDSHFIQTKHAIFYILQKKKSTLVKPAFTAHYSFVVFCIRCAHIKYVGISYRFTASTNPTPGPCAGPYTFSLVTSRFSKKFKLFWCARAVGDEATNQYFFFIFHFKCAENTILAFHYTLNHPNLPQRCHRASPLTRDWDGGL